MKRMSRYSRASRVLVLLLCALLLAGMLPSYGALGASKKNSSDKGSLTVNLKTDFSKLPKNDTIEITLYKIGRVAQDTAAGWAFDAPFDKIGEKIIEAKEKSALQEVANELAGSIVKEEYDKYKRGTMVFSGNTAAKELQECDCALFQTSKVNTQ